MNRRPSYGILAVLLFVAIAVRVWSMAVFCFDGDEIFSLLVGRRDWYHLTMAAAADSVHPPLFYYLLHIWRLIGGESLAWLRLLPVSIGIASFLPLVLLCRELRLRPAELYTAVGMAALNPYLIFYSHDMRMYSLLMLTGFTSLWAFARALRVGAEGIGIFALLTLVNILLVFSHYYGCFLVLIECAYMLLWNRRRFVAMLLSSILTLLAFIPWIWITAKAVKAKGGLASNLSWIGRPNAESLKWFFVDLSGSAEFGGHGPTLAIWIFAIIGLALVVRFFRSGKDPKDQTFRFLVVFTFAPIACAYFASLVLPQSVWGHRHLVIVAGPFVALCGVAFFRLRGCVFRLAAITVASVWIVQAVSHDLRRDDKKVPWDELVVKVLRQEGPIAEPVRFYAVDTYLHFPMWFYLEGLKSGRLPAFANPVADLDELSHRAAKLEVKRTATMAEVPVAPHFWVGYIPDTWKAELPEKVLTDRHCRLGAEVMVKDRFHKVRAFPVWCE